MRECCHRCRFAMFLLDIYENTRSHFPLASNTRNSILIWIKSYTICLLSSCQQTTMCILSWSKNYETRKEGGEKNANLKRKRTWLIAFSLLAYFFFSSDRPFQYSVNHFDGLTTNTEKSNEFTIFDHFPIFCSLHFFFTSSCSGGLDIFIFLCVLHDVRVWLLLFFGH